MRSFAKLWRTSREINFANITSEDVCLNHLGISRKRFAELNEEKKDKREYIRRLIETSLPSLGRFMSEVYLKYDQRREDFKSKKSGKTYDALLQQMRAITERDTITHAQLLELVIAAYRLDCVKSKP